MNVKIQLAIGCICVAVFMTVNQLKAQHSSADAYVVSWNQGEALIDGRGRTNSINVSPASGSVNVGLTTQDMPRGSGIAVHTHSETEEILFIHGGSATLILGGERIQVAAGDTVFVPPGISHGLENPNSNVQLVGVVTPPGQVGFFREISWRPGDKPKQFTPEQIREIAARYDSD